MSPSRESLRNQLVHLGVLCLAVFGLSCSGASKPPSIVFILVDTLRYDYLGCYGFDGPISPNVDGLAAESVVFDRCYAPAPWTKPSVASMFTSLNPAGHGVTNHRGGMWGAQDEDLQKGVLRDEAYTFAEMLQAGGYATAAFVGNPWLTWEFGFDQGFDVYNSVVSPPADRITLEAERWLASRDDRKPFFLYLHFMDVHDPYAAPEAAYQAVRSSPSLATEALFSDPEWERVIRAHGNSEWMMDAQGNPREETRRLETVRGRYAAGVRDFDNRIGPFLERLRENGLLDNTYLVFTSDHGEELYDHGNWGHGYSLYEHQIRVPLMIRPPGGIAGGRRVDDVVGLIDLFPTLAAWGGTDATGAEGKDLSPVIAGDGSGGTPLVFSSAVRNNPQMWSLTAGVYKLIVNGSAQRSVMFDVVENPEETRSVAATRAKEFDELRATLDEILKAQEGQDLFTPTSRPISDEQLERLRSLGYID